jgi:hypothetical protein
MTKTNKILFSALALMLSAVSGVFAMPLLPARSGNTTTLLPNGNILITGGHLGDGTPTNKAEIYISSKATYEHLTMDTPRLGHTATLLPDGRVFIFGGKPTTSNYDAVRTYTLFDPKTNSFSSSTILDTAAAPRLGHSATLITKGDYRNMVMLCGGYRSGTYSSCDIVKFNNGTPSLHTSIHMIGESGLRRDFTATMLSNGNIFITGGRRTTSAGTYVQANVTFDVESNTFGTESALVIGRRDHAAVTLNDGRVAVIGGFNEGYIPVFDVNTDDVWYNDLEYEIVARHNPGYHGFLDTVELFDKYGKPTIISGGETGIKTLPYRVAKASAILSPGGRVYIYGGRGNIPVTFADIPVEFVEKAGNDSILKTNGAITQEGGANVLSIDQENSHIYFNLEKTALSRPVSGRIIDGDIFIPTSDKNHRAIKIGDKTGGGIEVSFVGNSKQGYSKKDIRASLDGFEVGRQYDRTLQSGNIEGEGLEFKDIDGRIYFYPIAKEGLEASSVNTYKRSVLYQQCSSGGHAAGENRYLDYLLQTRESNRGPVLLL